MTKRDHEVSCQQLLELLANDRQSQAGHMLFNLSPNATTLIREVCSCHCLKMKLFKNSFFSDSVFIDWVFLYVATWRDAYSFTLSSVCRWWRQLEIEGVRTLFLNSYMDHMPLLHLPLLPMMTFIRLMPWLQISFTWPNVTVVWCRTPPPLQSVEVYSRTYKQFLVYQNDILEERGEKDFIFSHFLQAPSCCTEVTCSISPGWGYSVPSVVKDQKCAVGCSSSFLCTIWKPQNWTAVHQSPFVCWIWRYKEVCVDPLICLNFKCKFCKYFFHYSFIFFLKILVFVSFSFFPGFLVWCRVL